MVYLVNNLEFKCSCFQILEDMCCYEILKNSLFKIYIKVVSICIFIYMNNTNVIY